MPVPQENLLFVEQASCLFKKGLLTMVQDLPGTTRGTVKLSKLGSCNRPLAKVLFINLLDGQDDHPTRKNNSCGMGILPVLVIFARGLIKAKKYAIDFSTLANQNIKCSAGHKYDYLIRQDLQLAADLLEQTHSQTRGRDG